MKLPGKRFAVFAFVAIAVFALLFATRDWRVTSSRNSNAHCVRQLGLLGYIVYDGLQFAYGMIEERRLLSRDLTPFRDYLAARRSENASARRAKPSRRNVVFIQFESIDGLCVEATFRGRPVMPFLGSLAKNGIHFVNAVDNSSDGRTTDGEFLALASLLPLPDKPVYPHYDLSRVPSLPRVLASHGYTCVSMHGYKGSFWNRQQSHRSLGYHQSLFSDDLDRSERIGWGISDRSILQQALAMMERLPEPFFLHIILLTNHHPYDHVIPSKVAAQQSIVEVYAASVRYVDDSLQRFFQRFEQLPYARNSLVALYGDHDSGITHMLAEVFVYPEDHVVLDSVPLIILGAESPPQRLRKAAGLQDLPVIVLNELGLPCPPTFLGNPIASKRPNLHPDRGQQFITDSLELRESEAPVDLYTLTQLAIFHPDQLSQPAP